MKGLIFAAGLGTRLKPLTDNIPKALVTVAGKPMLQRVIEKFVESGINEIVVNVHHHADQIEEFIHRNRSFGINIHLSHEKEHPLETGGGLMRVMDRLDGEEPVIIHNADILTDFPLREMIALHASLGADVTLLVEKRPSSRQLLFDLDGRLKGWVNKTTGDVKPKGINPDQYSQKAFGGVHVISPSPFFEKLKKWATEEVFSIIPAYLALADDVNIRAYTPDGVYGWHDIGTIEKLRAAEDFLASK